ncbi:hypothetical protein O6H91_16G039500 [Diphasiastrum complanatum]|uniref:Uncharacterized protein n=1 Tax=Diphasiastrum complanatum TaxID=34168 RepID=A0ACC2BBM6_DIPCM|nr:hypothetical protein O6H91_16G039500 [Diphasiastrum complanatum]
MEEAKQHEVRAVLERLLDGADMETMTESKVRKMVASQTDLDPAAPGLKKLVKELIDDYLERLNEQEQEGEKPADEVQRESKEEEQEEDDDEEEDGSGKLLKRKARQRECEGDVAVSWEQTQRKVKQQAVERDGEGDIIICQLSAKRNVVVQDWRGKTLVSIREYYEKDGRMMPSSKGISLTAEQWESLKNGIPSIEKAIKSLQ